MRDEIDLSSAAGIAIANVHGGGGASFCLNENNALNNASPGKVGSPTKRGAKRKSPSRGLGGMVLHPLPPTSPPALQPMRITPPLLLQSSHLSTVILQHALLSSSSLPYLSPPLRMADCCVGLMGRTCRRRLIAYQIVVVVVVVIVVVVIIARPSPPPTPDVC